MGFFWYKLTHNQCSGAVENEGYKRSGVKTDSVTSDFCGGTVGLPLVSPLQKVQVGAVETDVCPTGQKTC